MRQNDGALNGPQYANFGWNIAVNSDVIAVGDPAGQAQRAVTTYNRQASTLLTTYTNPDSSVLPDDNYFGWSIALSDTRLVVGSPFQSYNGNDYNGVVYIFDPSTAMLDRVLVDPTAQSSTNFGWSVAASASYIAVGVPSNDDGATPGRVDIFNAATGQFIRSILSPGATADVNFGWSVAINGGQIVVGSPFESGGIVPTGKVYIFSTVSGALERTIVCPDNSMTVGGDNFGWSVAAAGNTLIVGAANEKTISPLIKSKVYIFNLSVTP